MKQIAINTDYITLGQFLKLSDCISTGGQAKFFVVDTKIEVNGKRKSQRTETRAARCGNRGGFRTIRSR